MSKRGRYLGGHTVIGPHNFNWWSTTDSYASSDKSPRKTSYLTDDAVQPAPGQGRVPSLSLRMAQITLKLRRELRENRKIIVIK
jgi:hypothetical protein